MKKLFLSFLLTAFLLSGCASNNTQGSSFPFEIMLQLTDLPAHYERLDSSLSNVDNGTVCEVSLKNKNSFTGSYIIHLVAIFKDDASAEKYYQSLADHYLRGAYLPEGLSFIPSDPTDIYKLGCIDGSIDDVPTESCGLIQLHNNYAIEVTTNINEMNLNMSDFNQILQILDSRLPTLSK